MKAVCNINRQKIFAELTNTNGKPRTKHRIPTTVRTFVFVFAKSRRFLRKWRTKLKNTNTPRIRRFLFVRRA